MKKRATIGFTGSQQGLTPKQVEAVRKLLEELGAVDSTHHGDCIGADAQFHEMCRALKHPLHIHPLDKAAKRSFCEGAKVYPVRPYLKRNHDIVDAVDFLIAAPSGSEKLRSGTWATVRYARKRGVDIAIVFPDGRVESA